MTGGIVKSLETLVGVWRFELQTSCAQGRVEKIYLIGPSSFVLRHGTWFWTYFGSIWTQVGLKFWDEPLKWHNFFGAQLQRLRGFPKPLSPIRFRVRDQPRGITFSSFGTA